MARTAESGESRNEVGSCANTRTHGGKMRFGPFLGIGILLLVLWLGGFLMFHIAGLFIHLLLLFAIISIVIHLFTSAKTA
jgi:hypothetical protein